LTLVYVARRGDIRLIPGLAGLAILFASVGPWSLAQGPVWSQSARLDAAISSAYSAGETPEWLREQAAIARGSLQFLLISEGEADIAGILARHGVEVDADAGFSTLLAALGIPDEPGIDRPYSIRITRDDAVPVLVRQTPFAYGRVFVWQDNPILASGLTFELTDDETLSVSRDGEPVAEVPLGVWVEAQNPPQIIAPAIDFAIDGRAWRLVVDEADLRGTAGASGETRQITYMAGTLFSAEAP
jgi:hypothetical protein